MGKTGDKKSFILWIVLGVVVYYILSQFYFAYLVQYTFFSALLGWFFALPRYVGFIATLMDFLTKLVLLIAQPLMYIIIGGVLGLLIRLIYKKLKK